MRRVERARHRERIDRSVPDACWGDIMKGVVWQDNERQVLWLAKIQKKGGPKRSDCTGTQRRAKETQDKKIWGRDSGLYERKGQEEHSTCHKTLGLLPCSDCLVWHKVIAVSRAMLEFQSFVGWGAKPLFSSLKGMAAEGRHGMTPEIF